MARRRMRGVVAAFLGVVVGSGVAAAAIPDAGGVINGCYSTRSGALRVVEEGATCNKGELALQWNQRGQQGDPGPVGPIGPQGPAGRDGADGKDGDPLLGSSCALPDSTAGTITMNVAADGAISFVCDVPHGGGGGGGPSPDDADGDGVPNASDNCPDTSNATQEDSDGDGTGDACDPLPDYYCVPTGAEVVDGTDNDCDGVIDESEWIDNDGDGFAPPTDCDDTDPAVNPDATELLDGVDENCDGVLMVSSYTGPAGTRNVGACRDGVAYVDTSANGWTSATYGEVLPTTEIPANGIDDDCDGLTDE